MLPLFPPFPPLSLYLLSFPISGTPFPDALRSLRSLSLARFPIGRGPTSKKTSLIRIAEWQSRLTIVRFVHMDRSTRSPPRDNRESLSSRYSTHSMEERSHRSRYRESRFFSHRFPVCCSWHTSAFQRDVSKKKSLIARYAIYARYALYSLDSFVVTIAQTRNAKRFFITRGSS